MPLLAKLHGIEDALIQSKTHPNEDALSFSIHVSNQLAAWRTVGDADLPAFNARIQALKLLPVYLQE